tara:strand:+ start:4590 stop:6878 length:2289 start_codon:yes stop_codon:yes gene_type:complete
MPKPHQYKGPSASKYGAPKFKHVGDVRRERYVNNFMTTQAMEEQAAAVRAAPFDLDSQYRQNLLQTTDQQLKGFGNKGDYENMTVDIYRASTEFNKKKEPLSKNLAAYTAYQEHLEDLYNNKKIDSEDKDGTMFLSKQGYEGLSFDESGQANYFTGIEAVHNPDIDALLDTAIGNIDEEEYDFQRSNEGNQLAAGEDGALTVKQKSSVSKHQKGRSPERVAAVFDNVMRRPEVMAYLNRKSEIHAAYMQGKEGEYLTKTTENVDKALVGIDAAIAEEKDPDKAAMLEAQRGQLEEMKSEIAGAMENPEEAADLVRELDKNHRIQEYKDQYLTSYGIMNTTVDKKTSSQILGYDKLWLQDEKLRKKLAETAGIQLPVLTTSDNVLEYTDDMGPTYATGIEHLESLTSGIKEVEKLLEEPNLEQSTIDSYTAKYNNLAAQEYAAIERFQQEFEDMTPEMLNNPEYLRLKEAAANKYRPSTSGTAMLMNNFSGGTAPPFMPTSNNDTTQKALMDFMKGNGLPTSNKGIINYAPTVTQNHMPGLDSKLQPKFKNALNGLFTGGMTAANGLMVYAPKNDGSMQTIDENNMMTISDARDRDFLPDDATMKTYGVISVNSAGSPPMFKINWTSKDGDDKSGSLYVPLAQGSLMDLGPGVADYLTSDYIGIMSSIAAGENNPGDVANIPYHTTEYDPETGTDVAVSGGYGTIRIDYKRDSSGTLLRKMATLVNDNGVEGKTYDVEEDSKFTDLIMHGDNGRMIVPDTNYR